MKLKDENKINLIFRATLLLVEKNGLAGLTMDAVAKEARIATGTLYIYFRNKQALVAGLFKECMKSSASVYFKNYDASSPFKVGFHRIWLNIIQYKLVHFDELVFLDQCFNHRFIDEKTKAEAKKMFDPLRELIERGKREKLIKNIDSFWLISFMVGYINELVKRIIYHNKKMNDELFDINFQLCWDGIKA